MKHRFTNLSGSRASVAAAILLLMVGAGVFLHHHAASAGNGETSGSPARAVAAGVEGLPQSVGGRWRERAQNPQAQRREALDLAARLTTASVEFAKLSKAYRDSLPPESGWSRLSTAEEEANRPRYPKDLEKELQAMNPEQLREVVDATAGADHRRTLSLGFILGTWMKGQDRASVPPLLSALDLVERALLDLSPGEASQSRLSPTLSAIMPSHCPEPAAAAMADFVIRHRDEWSGSQYDASGNCLRLVLLNSGLDQQRRREIEALPHDVVNPR